MTDTIEPTKGSGVTARMRTGSQLMKPESLAAIQPSRFSGARAFMNKMLRERWDISMVRFDVDANAEGTVVYSIKAPDREFSFICFSRPPSRTARTGRIIGQAWDMVGTLNEGPATDADIESARREIPKLYTGRATHNALIWCRSNRSMRVFDQTLDALAAGHQPVVEDLSKVCYLMRNTGLDGNGTFGTRSFPSLGRHHPLGGVLQAQLLTAYMMREYSCDLVEHLARLKSDRAVSLEPSIRRYLGVGNGSALGLIFFVHKHPRLINAWIGARETAIAKARGLELGAGDPRIGKLIDLLQTAITFRQQDRMVYEAFTSSAEIASDLKHALETLKVFRDNGLIQGVAHATPLDMLVSSFGETACPEALETLHSLLIELVPDEADSLFTGIDAPDEFTVSPAETLASLADLIRRDYSWALATDMSAPEAYKFVWYKSETAEEPRRGAREEVPEAIDLGLDVCGSVQALMDDIELVGPSTTVARLLLKHPEHRYLVARIQSLRDAQFHTPHANINAESFVPIDLVRLMNCGIHGVDKTRDFLNRNLRGVLYHGAPTPDEIRSGFVGTWFYPSEPIQ
ncbi:hypothetical protein EDC40_107223 [Aminobacter aminovorans]|uniref:Uncharacterized protein n=1 Tax=Aminobacter aminovorans TaxID=83263 RepID=A0A381IM07_AMIAI|nr:hypothetical protein [Aminobacter aminovorans]TCS25023.1 hypothetical protein EDC40_107223 [Aminobacter aminovorans]SUY28528.1 Uncharacterised protein [Aminobacter aminovorans]